MLLLGGGMSIFFLFLFPLLGGRGWESATERYCLEITAPPFLGNYKVQLLEDNSA